jgi:hypothetical protein
MPLSPYCTPANRKTGQPKPSCTCHQARQSEKLIHHTCPVCGPTHNGGSPMQRQADQTRNTVNASLT